MCPAACMRAVALGMNASGIIRTSRNTGGGPASTRVLGLSARRHRRRRDQGGQRTLADRPPVAPPCAARRPARSSGATPRAAHGPVGQAASGHHPSALRTSRRVAKAASTAARRARWPDAIRTSDHRPRGDHPGKTSPWSPWPGARPTLLRVGRLRDTGTGTRLTDPEIEDRPALSVVPGVAEVHTHIGSANVPPTMRPRSPSPSENLTLRGRPRVRQRRRRPQPRPPARPPSGRMPPRGSRRHRPDAGADLFPTPVLGLPGTAPVRHPRHPSHADRTGRMRPNRGSQPRPARADGDGFLDPRAPLVALFRQVECHSPRLGCRPTALPRHAAHRDRVLEPHEPRDERAGRRLLEHLGRGVLQDAPPVHAGDAVGDRERPFPVVRREDRGRAVGAVERPDLGPHLHPQPGAAVR